MVPINGLLMDRLSIKLPANMACLLRCGHLKVDDVMELLTNTMSQVVTHCDNLSEAMEKFAQSLYADLIGVLEGIDGENVTLRVVPSAASVTYEALANELKKYLEGGMVNRMYLERPTENADKEWKLVLEMMAYEEQQDGTKKRVVKKVSLNELVSTLGATDITKTDWSLEVSQTGIDARCADKNGDDVVMFTIPLVNKKYDEAGLMSPEDKKKLDNLSIDTKTNTLSYNGISYTLTPVNPNPTVIRYEYRTPVIEQFYYTPVSADGGTISPTFTIKQDKVAVMSNGSEAVTTLKATSMKEAAECGMKLEFKTTFTAVNAETGVATISPSTIEKGKILANDIRLMVVNENDTQNHYASSDSVQIAQDAASWSISVPVALNETLPAALPLGGSKYNVPVKKTKGVEVIMVNVTSEDSADMVVASYKAVDDNNGTVEVGVKSNLGTEPRQAFVQVVTNLGTKTFDVYQDGVVKSDKLYFGLSGTVAEIPSDVTDEDADGITSVALSDTTSISVSATLEMKKKIQWVALPTTGYSVADGYPVNKSGRQQSITRKTSGGYNIYYIGSDDKSALSNEFTWKIIKN